MFVDMATLVLFTDMTLMVLLVNVPLSVALAHTKYHRLLLAHQALVPVAFTEFTIYYSSQKKMVL